MYNALTDCKALIRISCFKILHWKYEVSLWITAYQLIKKSVQDWKLRIVSKVLCTFCSFGINSRTITRTYRKNFSCSGITSWKTNCTDHNVDKCCAGTQRIHLIEQSFKFVKHYFFRNCSCSRSIK